MVLWILCMFVWTSGFQNLLTHTHFDMFVDEWTSANESPVMIHMYNSWRGQYTKNLYHGIMLGKKFKLQECIPVGRVPPGRGVGRVRAWRGRRGVGGGGVSVEGWPLPTHPPTPWTEFLTHAYENNTFPQLR